MTTTIGIDVGGSKVLVVRREGGTVVAEERSSVQSADLIAVAADAARRLWTDDVAAVGVGVAGLVDWPDGTFVWGPHVAGTNVPLRAELSERLGVPVIADNDANLSAVAEHRLGAGRGFENLVLVTLGTGIGGAAVLDGALRRGGSFAGDWGHVRMVPDGVQCACGKRGCWETLASGPALARLTAEFVAGNPNSRLAGQLGQPPVDPERVTAAADAGDETARGLVAQVGAALGIGLSNLVTIFDPDVIVVGGGLGSVGESILGPARRVAADALHGGTYRMLPPILVAGLGPAAGAVGAALLAYDLVTGRLIDA